MSESMQTVGAQVTKDTRDRLDERARQEGKYKSDIIREAIEAYLDGMEAPDPRPRVRDGDIHIPADTELGQFLKDTATLFGMTEQVLIGVAVRKYLYDISSRFVRE